MTSFPPPDSDGGASAYGSPSPAGPPYAQQPYVQQPYAPQPYSQQPYAPQPYSQQPYAPQPYGQPGYGQPAYGPTHGPGNGLYPAAGPGQNGLGIAGMIVGIAGLVLCWIPFFGPFVALVGTILSGVALPQARGRQQGTGTAIAGLVCGILGLLLGIAYIVIIVAALNVDSGTSI